MLKKIYLIGGGGHCKVIIDIIESLEIYEIMGFYDDFNENNLFSYKYLGKIKAIPNIKSNNVYFCCIGDNQTRKKICEKFYNLEWVNLIHPSCQISKYSQYGVGNCFMRNCVIESNTIIGNFNIFNTNCSINHDNNIGNFNHIAPGSNLCGNITIKDNNLIGVGACIIPKIKIGSNNIIGAGSILIKNIENNKKIVGISRELID